MGDTHFEVEGSDEACGHDGARTDFAVSNYLGAEPESLDGHGHGNELDCGASGASDRVEHLGSLVQGVQYVIERELLVWRCVACFGGGDGR